MKNINGLFIGLSTIDIIYLVESPPKVDEKTIAIDQVTCSGGPATNAAITFSALGGNSALSSVVGQHSLNKIIYDEFTQFNIEHLELLPNYKEPITLSSINVKKSTGERSIVYLNPIKNKITKFSQNYDFKNIDIVMLDGHEMKLSIEVCRQLKKSNITTILDGGSWKEGTKELLPYIDYVICSEKFLPPDCFTSKDVINYVSEHRVNNIAITKGPKPIIVSENGNKEYIQVDNTEIIDTLGAGDIFHGAFCYCILKSDFDFRSSILNASKTATNSCKYFGPRKWIYVDENAL
mgnify:CR=1 FL=1